MVSYTIQTMEPQGPILGCFKEFDPKFIPSQIFQISIGIPREGQDLYLDFEIGEGSTFDPETENIEIILKPTPYLLDDGSWGETGYDDFYKDMVCLCMSRGWKLLLTPEAPEELKKFTK